MGEGKQKNKWIASFVEDLETRIDQHQNGWWNSDKDEEIKKLKINCGNVLKI
jgi:hypothetical protein